MTALDRVLAGLYAGMLRCYPASVRSEFGEEMLAVFMDSLRNYSHTSALGMLVVLLRELIDWPFVLVDEYKQALRRRITPLVNGKGRPIKLERRTLERIKNVISRSQPFDMDKRQMILAALPPLLLGLGIMVSSFIRTDVWYRLPTWQLYLSAVVVLIPGIVVGVGGLWAFQKNLPDWGLTWVGTAFMGMTLFTAVFVDEGVDEGWLTLTPVVELVLGLVFFLVGLSLLILIARRSWPQAGLFTIAVASTMGLSLFQSLTAAPFNRDDLAVFAGPSGLIFALLIYTYVRQAAMIRIGIIIGVGVLNSALALIASNAWGSWLANRGAPSPFLSLIIILTGLLLSGPLAGLMMRRIGRPGGSGKPAV